MRVPLLFEVRQNLVLELFAEDKGPHEALFDIMSEDHIAIAGIDDHKLGVECLVNNQITLSMTPVSHKPKETS